MMRQCGSGKDRCTLCCKLVPVADLQKKAGQRCKYQRHSGCTVYNKPQAGFPPCCAVWNCRWLVNDDTDDLRRPDRAHYVLDILPDFVELEDNNTGERTAVQVVQIWVDPDYPDAHRDPALRAWLERNCKQTVVGLVRYSSNEAMALWPPSMTADGQWHEVGSKWAARPQHSLTEIEEALGGKIQAVFTE